VLGGDVGMVEELFGQEKVFDYLKRSVKAQMREANKMNARFVIFVGGDEYKQGNLNLKNMQSGEEMLVPFESSGKLINLLKM